MFRYRSEVDLRGSSITFHFTTHQLARSAGHYSPRVLLSLSHSQHWVLEHKTRPNVYCFHVGTGDLNLGSHIFMLSTSHFPSLLPPNRIFLRLLSPLCLIKYQVLKIPLPTNTLFNPSPLTVQLWLALNSWTSCLHLPNVGITDTAPPHLLYVVMGNHQRAFWILNRI